MTEINLLPWREGLREKKRKQFFACLVASGVCALIAMVVVWSVLTYRLEDQEQANQLISSSNQELDTKLAKIESLQTQRNTVIERMRLIQGLQGQRPVSVRLLDEFVRMIPDQMYLTRVTRVANRITIEGRADHPDTVAIMLRQMKSSPWFNNALMNSFEVKQTAPTPDGLSVLPMRPESAYGHFVLSVDVAELALTTLKGNANPAPVGAS